MHELLRIIDLLVNIPQVSSIFHLNLIYHKTLEDKTVNNILCFLYSQKKITEIFQKKRAF